MTSYISRRLPVGGARTINYRGPLFAQPVFVDDELIVAGPMSQAYAPRVASSCQARTYPQG